MSKSEISFDKRGSQHPDIEPDYASVNSTIHTIEMPLLYGYNFIKEGPYGMAFFFGPKFKYILNSKSKLEFTNFDQEGIKEKLYPVNMNAVAGVGVNISNIFFDFRYEVGLRNISKSVTYIESNSDGTEEVANICNYFSEQMDKVSNSSKKQDELIKNAVYGNLKLMKKTLSPEQYAKYNTLLTITLQNKGIELK